MGVRKMEDELIAARTLIEQARADYQYAGDPAVALAFAAQAQAEALVCIARGMWKIIELVFDEKKVIEVGVRS